MYKFNTSLKGAGVGGEDKGENESRVLICAYILLLLSFYMRNRCLFYRISGRERDQRSYRCHLCSCFYFLFDNTFQLKTTNLIHLNFSNYFAKSLQGQGTSGSNSRLDRSNIALTSIDLMNISLQHFSQKHRRTELQDMHTQYMTN